MQFTASIAVLCSFEIRHELEEDSRSLHTFGYFGMQ